MRTAPQNSTCPIWPFTDAGAISDYALEALRWAVENGIMSGYGNGQLAPQGLATRAEAAQILKNLQKSKT